MHTSYSYKVTFFKDAQLFTEIFDLETNGGLGGGGG